MWQFLASLTSGVAGAVIGSVVTRHLMTCAARNQARRETLFMAAEALENYRVAYAQWYVEYLSPEAQASGTWAKRPGKPDPVYLKLMHAVDTGRGRLRIINGVLYAHFPEDVMKPLYTEILQILMMTAGDQQADCRQVDLVATKACDLIPDMIRRLL